MFNNLTFWEFIMKGGYTMYVLIFCSVLSLAVIVQKLLAFSSISQKAIVGLMQKVTGCLIKGDVREALYICTHPSESKPDMPLLNVFKFILEHPEYPKDELMNSGLIKLDQEMIRFEQGLGILATLGSVSPFIGLFGTVVGIIRSFTALSLNDTTGYDHLMSGIAEALVATAGGLIVAVPAVIFYNYFSKKIKISLAYAEGAIHEVIYELKKKRGTDAAPLPD